MQVSMVHSCRSEHHSCDHCLGSGVLNAACLRCFACPMCRKLMPRVHLRPTPSAAAAPEPGRLHQLEAIVWPDCPPKVAQAAASQCARVALNPQLHSYAVRGQVRLPACDPAVALDAPAAAAVAPMPPLAQGRCSVTRDSGPCAPELHIADKFRVAYILQAARRRRRHHNLQAQEEKRWLHSSHGLQLQEQWLDAA